MAGSVHSVLSRSAGNETVCRPVAVARLESAIVLWMSVKKESLYLLNNKWKEDISLTELSESTERKYLILLY